MVALCSSIQDSMETKYKILTGVGILIISIVLVNAITLNTPTPGFYTNLTTVPLNATIDDIDNSNVSFWVDNSTSFTKDPICFFESVAIDAELICDFKGIQNIIPTENLVLYLQMNQYQGSSSTADSALSNNIVTVSGAVFGANNGSVLGGYVLDGSNDFLAINDDNSLDITNNFTLAGWVKRRDGTLATLNRHTLISKDGAGDTTGAYNLYVNEFTNQGFSYETNNLGGCNSANTIPVNEWTFISVTMDAGTVKMYTNGEQVQTSVGAECTGVAAATANTRQLILGRRAGFNGWYNGTMDNIMIFNKSLSTQEMAALFFIENMEFFWKVNATNGTTTTETATQNFTIDTIAPIINSNVIDGERFPNSTVFVNITVNDTNPDTLVVYMDNVLEFSGVSENFTKTFDLSKGVHRMNVTAVDLAGNSAFRKFLFYVLEDNYIVTYFSNQNLSIAYFSNDNITKEVTI